MPLTTEWQAQIASLEALLSPQPKIWNLALDIESCHVSLTPAARFVLGLCLMRVGCAVGAVWVGVLGIWNRLGLGIVVSGLNLRREYRAVCSESCLALWG